MPEHMRGFVTFAYKTGWRLGEITNLTRDKVEFKCDHTIESRRGKNSEPRTVVVDDEVCEILNRQWKLRGKSGSILPFVRLNAKEPIRSSGLINHGRPPARKLKNGERLFHDLRRSAIHNMVRAGVPERVAMTISGHKTRNVFERYNVVSEEDLRQAAKKQAEYLDKRLGTVSGTVVDIKEKRGTRQNR
jgi:integrase